MGTRPASSKATRGASKGKRPASSSSSNPSTMKFRSQYNSLAVIAKGAPSKKSQNREAIKKAAKDAVARKKLLDGLDSISMVESNPRSNQLDESKAIGKEIKSKKSDDAVSNVSGGSKLTTASFASVWSNCTNSSLNEFFQVWNPNLETHKDALAVIAGLSQLMSSKGAEQSDSEYALTIFKIMSAPDTPTNIITGALLALSFVMRKLPADVINEHFNVFYNALKILMDKHHTSKKKTLIKSLVRCFACLSKSHPLGKEAIEKCVRKKINLAIRQYRVQGKIHL